MPHISSSNKESSVINKTSNQPLALALEAHAQKSSRAKKLIIVAVVLVVAYFFLAGGKNQENKTQFQTAEVMRGDLHVTVAASGTLEPTNVVTIGSEISGTISDVYADINDPVTKGQLLVQIDTATLEDTLEKSKAALASAKAAVAQAEATLKEEKADLARQQELSRLSNNRLPSKADLDAAEASVARAEANLVSATAEVAQAEATVRANDTNLKKASISSPIDGIVLSRDIEPGQTVAATYSAPDLMEIAEDLSKMELVVYVDEADVGQVKAGQVAHFTVDAWPTRTYPATISRVSYGSTTTDNVVTYKTTLIVDNPDLSLRPGMTASAQINTQSRERVLLVPNAALRFTPPKPEVQEDKDKESLLSSILPRPPRRERKQPPTSLKEGETKDLWTLDNMGDPSPVAVTVGVTNGSLTEVSGAGLKEGMKIITGSITTTGN